LIISGPFVHSYYTPPIEDEQNISFGVVSLVNSISNSDNRIDRANFMQNLSSRGRAMLSTKCK
jgi:hypothetical protein